MERGERTLCVATWGDPRAWRYAEYVCGDKRVRAFSTLNILCEVERPVKVIVVVLDTLADYNAVVEAKDYGGVEERARSYAKQYLCGIEAEVVVLPGIYERRDSGKRLSFESDPRSEFLPLLTYVVFQKALEVDATSIALDVSHGMNFVPTLALKAAEEAAASLAAARVRRVKLRVYQSDPYPTGFQGLARSSKNVCEPERSGDELPSLRYNLILERAFEPWDLARFASYRSEQALKVLTDPRGCELDDARNLLESWALPLLGAFRLGAILQLASLAKATPLEELRNAVERAIACWKLKRRVLSVGDSALKVASGAKFTSGFWALIHACAVLEGARKLLGFGAGRARLEEATATLNELNELKKLVRGSKVVGELVDREISKLDYTRRRLAELREGEWVSYSKLQLGLGPEEGRGDESVFKRDFIAHAGFHTSVLEVRLTGKELEVRVGSDQWKRVSKMLREVTQEWAA